MLERNRFLKKIRSFDEDESVSMDQTIDAYHSRINHSIPVRYPDLSMRGCCVTYGNSDKLNFRCVSFGSACLGVQFRLVLIIYVSLPVHPSGS